MRFCAAVGVPKKSGVARFFMAFATAVIANFQDRLVVTASIPLRIVKKCVAVFVRLAKWFRFAAFGRQPEMRLRNLYGIMPAACGLPACGRLLTCRFSIANAARFVKIPGDTKTESRGTPRLSVGKVFGNSGATTNRPCSPRLFPLDGCRRLAGHVVEDHVDGEPCRLNAADNVRECVLGEIHTGDG